jgi:hypothetical protein
MHTNSPLLLTDIRLSRFSAHDDGMHVELSSSTDHPGPVLTFRQDEALGTQVVIHPSDRDIALSLQDLEKAIAFARAEVRSESSCDPPSSD